MSEPGDRMEPLPLEDEEGSRLRRTPYAFLGVAAVVATVFATVAALASTRTEAQPPPERRAPAELTPTRERPTATTAPTDASTPASSTTATTSSTTATTNSNNRTSTPTQTPITSTPAQTSSPSPSPPPPPPKPPVAQFSANCPDPGMACAFDAGASSDPDGTILGYAWDFGDGSNASGRTTQHTYSAPGTYTVRLTVVDNSGRTDGTTRTVTVEQPQ